VTELVLCTTESTVRSDVFVFDPTNKLPTDTVDDEVGKLWSASKVVELGLNVTEPAVDRDM
jgi:hypothetical protein